MNYKFDKKFLSAVCDSQYKDTLNSFSGCEMDDRYITIPYTDRNYTCAGKLEMLRTSKVQAISMFSGCGGLDIGTQMAGVKVISTMDFEPSTVETMRNNAFFQFAEHNCQDIRDIDGKFYSSVLRQNNPEKLILVGGPPCQPFSKGAYWITNEKRKGINDERNMVGEYLRMIDEIRPDGFLLENVESILHPTNRAIVEFIESRTEQMGYRIMKVRANAVDYGVPQRRKRVEPYRKFRLEVQSGVILRKLLSIKNRYFNDKLVNLWNLLYLFYSNKKSVFSRKNFKEFVFVKKYNEVFEDMIDYLLGDSNKDPEIYSLKYQEDGKIVDHLFQGASIVTDRRNVYYVGDSKYYKDTTKLSGNSIFKQYTYARNIVQKQLDWFYGNAKDKGKYLNYRDEGSEGYNITPNFFITGIVSNGYFVHKDYLTNTKEDFPPAYQFPDRLFDRDTFFLQKYDINFLFVLYGYVAELGFSRTAFKNGAQEHFKQDFTSYLNKKYIFNLLLVKDNITFDEAMNLHFRTLIGKIFRPFMDNDKLLILAQLRKSSDDSLDKNDNSGLDLLKKIHNEFLIYQYTLGTDIEKALNSGPIDDDVLYSPE